MTIENNVRNPSANIIGGIWKKNIPFPVSNWRYFMQDLVIESKWQKQCSDRYISHRLRSSPRCSKYSPRLVANIGFSPLPLSPFIGLLLLCWAIKLLNFWLVQWKFFPFVCIYYLCLINYYIRSVRSFINICDVQNWSMLIDWFERQPIVIRVE